MKKFVYFLILILIIFFFLPLPFLKGDYDKEGGYPCIYFQAVNPTNCHYPVTHTISLYKYLRDFVIK